MARTIQYKYVNKAQWLNDIPKTISILHSKYGFYWDCGMFCCVKELRPLLEKNNAKNKYQRRMMVYRDQQKRWSFVIYKKNVIEAYLLHDPLYLTEYDNVGWPKIRYFLEKWRKAYEQEQLSTRTMIDSWGV